MCSLFLIWLLIYLKWKLKVDVFSFLVHNPKATNFQLEFYLVIRFTWLCHGKLISSFLFTCPLPETSEPALISLLCKICIFFTKCEKPDDKMNTVGQNQAHRKVLHTCPSPVKVWKHLEAIHSLRWYFLPGSAGHIQSHRDVSPTEKQHFCFSNAQCEGEIRQLLWIQFSQITKMKKYLFFKKAVCFVTSEEAENKD